MGKHRMQVIEEQLPQPSDIRARSVRRDEVEQRPIIGKENTFLAVDVNEIGMPRADG